MWFKLAFHRNATHSWAAIGPFQVIWNRPDARPLVWLTTNPPKLLFGRM
jgi:hypothetical protein